MTYNNTHACSHERSVALLSLVAKLLRTHTRFTLHMGITTPQKAHEAVSALQSIASLSLVTEFLQTHTDFALHTSIPAQTHTRTHTATSKLRSIDDLDAVKTHGFRGEALASLKDISMLEVCMHSARRELCYTQSARMPMWRGSALVSLIYMPCCATSCTQYARFPPLVEAYACPASTRARCYACMHIVCRPVRPQSTLTRAHPDRRQVVTRPTGSRHTLAKLWKGGRCVQCGRSAVLRDTPGTTVTVHSLFENVPVCVCVDLCVYACVLVYVCVYMGVCVCAYMCAYSAAATVTPYVANTGATLEASLLCMGARTHRIQLHSFSYESGPESGRVDGDVGKGAQAIGSRGKKTDAPIWGFSSPQVRRRSKEALDINFVKKVVETLALIRPNIAVVLVNDATGAVGWLSGVETACGVCVPVLRVGCAHILEHQSPCVCEWCECAVLIYRASHRCVCECFEVAAFAFCKTD